MPATILVVELEVEFEEDSRRVATADLETATLLAAAVFRTHLISLPMTGTGTVYKVKGIVHRALYVATGRRLFQ